jgi:hypothetical protein
MRVMKRVHHFGLGNCRPALEAAVEQCARENGGYVVGHPTIVRGGLIVDEDCAWWEEWMRIHGPKLHVASLLEMGLPPEHADSTLAQIRERWGKRRPSNPADGGYGTQ